MKTEKETHIRANIAHLDEQLVKDTLALLLASDDTKKVGAEDSCGTQCANFAQAILYLKKYYHFPELNAFTTEADLVYVNAGDRRYLLTDRDAPAPQPRNSVPEAIPSENGGSDEYILDNAFEPKKNDSSRFNRLEL